MTVQSQVEPQSRDWRALRDAGATEWGKHEGAYDYGPGAWGLELRWDDMVVEASDDAELPRSGTFGADFSAVNERLRQLAGGLTVVSEEFYRPPDADG